MSGGNLDLKSTLTEKGRTEAELFASRGIWSLKQSHLNAIQRDRFVAVYVQRKKKRSSGEFVSHIAPLMSDIKELTAMPNTSKNGKCN